MKAGFVAVAAAMALGVNAKGHRAHEAFHHKNIERDVHIPKNTTSGNDTECGCYTVWVTTYGEPTLYFPPEVPATTAPATTTTIEVKTTPAPAPVTTSTIVVVPTPFATICPTPGVYTIPATTITLTESTTVCAPTSTKVPSGNHTYGGITTVVETATTIVCPYATTILPSGGVVTSTILTTTYVCPTPGTYTIAPLTTSCVNDTVIVYPTPTSYPPGTYTQPEVVATVTETDYVIFCPYTSPASIPAPTSAPAPAPVPESASIPAPSSAPAPAPVPESPSIPAPESAPAPAAKPSSPPKPTTKTPSLGGTGNQWAITYTPYSTTGSCKSASEVLTDITLIASKGFTTVRLYATDCSGLTTVGDACASVGIKLILGVFIDKTGISGAQPQITDLVAFAHWNIVELVVVGNEAIFNGYCSASELAAFITSARETFKSSGYSGPITTTETLNILQASASTLCGAIDVVGCNIHAFFNADVDAGSAGSFVAGQLALAAGLCPGKSALNLESGWPSAGSCNGKACPGEQEQATAIAGIKKAVGDKTVMFSFQNDAWKDAGAFGCEQSWGAIHLY